MKQIQSKKIFITYKNIQTQISNEFFFNHLNQNIKIDNYIICNDIIQGDLKQIYIFIENNQKIRNLYKSFHVKIDNVFYHYHEIITKIRNKKEIIDHLLLKKNIINNEFFSAQNYLLEKAKEVDATQIEKIVMEEFPQILLKRGESFLKTLKYISNYYKPVDLFPVEPKHTLSEFKFTKKIQTQFNKGDPTTHSFIVHGNTEAPPFNIASTLPAK
jgi:hypothetical protein